MLFCLYFSAEISCFYSWQAGFCFALVNIVIPALKFFSAKSNIWIISQLVSIVCLFSRERVLFFRFFKYWVILDCVQLNVFSVYSVNSVIFLWRECWFHLRWQAFNFIGLKLHCVLGSSSNLISVLLSLSEVCPAHVWFRGPPEICMEFMHRIWGSFSFLWFSFSEISPSLSNSCGCSESLVFSDSSTAVFNQPKSHKNGNSPCSISFF